VPTEFDDFIAMHIEIRDINVHAQLQYDLVERLRRFKGDASGVMTP
jgi:hypothetical protein